MDVKFTYTTSEKLNDLDIINGQIIALTDKDGLFYDLNGERRAVSDLSDLAHINSVTQVQLVTWEADD